jgi:MYXO-CTERM domain-containing protein
MPPSGATFPIGDTTVNCSATDSGGTTTGSFSVHVASAPEQLDALLADSAAVGPGGSVVNKVIDVQQALAADDLNTACNTLRHSYPNAVTAQSGKKVPADVAGELIADANRIADVLACSSESGPPLGVVVLVPLGLAGVLLGRRRLELWVPGAPEGTKADAGRG